MYICGTRKCAGCCTTASKIHNQRKANPRGRLSSSTMSAYSQALLKGRRVGGLIPLEEDLCNGQENGIILHFVQAAIESARCKYGDFSESCWNVEEIWVRKREGENTMASRRKLNTCPISGLGCREEEWKLQYGFSSVVILLQWTGLKYIGRISLQPHINRNILLQD